MEENLCSHYNTVLEKAFHLYESKWSVKFTIHRKIISDQHKLCVQTAK